MTVLFVAAVLAYLAEWWLHRQTRKLLDESMAQTDRAIEVARDAMEDARVAVALLNRR